MEKKIIVYGHNGVVGFCGGEGGRKEEKSFRIPSSLKFS
jgi:hypothetical protein